MFKNAYLKKHSRWRPDKRVFQNRFENSQFESKTLDSFFQWKLRFQTFEKWEFSGQKFRPRSVIKVERGKLAYKTSTLMPNAGPYKKCQICWDNRIKQDSYSWMSKLLLKERIIEIGLELVICRKKTLHVRIQLFLHQKKIGLIQETKNSSYCSVVALTKTERSSKLVVGNIDRPMHKLQCNPQNKFQLFHVWAFLVY